MLMNFFKVRKAREVREVSLSIFIPISLSISLSLSVSKSQFVSKSVNQSVCLSLSVCLCLLNARDLGQSALFVKYLYIDLYNISRH